jgi:hypothetical protein
MSQMSETAESDTAPVTLREQIEIGVTLRRHASVIVDSYNDLNPAQRSLCLYLLFYALAAEPAMEAKFWQALTQAQGRYTRLNTAY